MAVGLNTEVVIKLLALKDASVDAAAKASQKAIDDSLAKMEASAKKASAAINESFKRITDQGASKAIEAASAKIRESMAQTVKVTQQAMSQMGKGMPDSTFDLVPGINARQRRVIKPAEDLLNAQQRYNDDKIAAKIKKIEEANVKVFKQAEEEKIRALKKFEAEQLASLNRIGEAYGKVERVANTAALAFGAVVAAVGVVGHSIVAKAAEMEMFSRKLETIFKSAGEAREAISYSVKFAAETPFRVDEIVDATTKLEMYGARSREILPKVADLAAGMGKRLDETALVMGKAWSGSLEGFESLRNEFGITTAELVKFGAKMNEQGGISIKTTGELNKARDAMMQIIQVNFAGASAKQMDTFSGAVSNLQDSVARLSVALGQRLIPVLTDTAKKATKVVEVFENMPDIFKDLIVFAGSLTGGLAGLGLVVSGGISLYAGYKRSLAELTIASKTFDAATGVSTVSLTAFGAALNRAKIAALAFIASPVGIALAAISAAALSASYIYSKMAEESKKLGDAITEESKRLAKARNAWKDYIAVINEAGKDKGVNVKQTNDTAKQLKEIDAALSKIDVIKLREVLHGKGYDSESISKQKKTLEDQDQQLNKKQELLEKALKDKGKATQSMGGYSFSYDIIKPENVKLLKDQFGETLNTEAQIKSKLEEIKKERDNLEPSLTKWSKIEEQYKQIDKLNEDMQTKNKDRQDYYNYSDKIKGATNFQKKLKDIDKNMQDNAKQGAIAFEKAYGGIWGKIKKTITGKSNNKELEKDMLNPDKLLPLLNSKDPTIKEIAKSQLDLIIEKKETQKKMDDEEKKRQQAEKKRNIDAFEEQSRAHKQYAVDQIEIGKMNIDEQVKYEKKRLAELNEVTKPGQKVSAAGPKTEKDWMIQQYQTDADFKKKVDQEKLEQSKTVLTKEKEAQKQHFEELKNSTEQYLQQQKSLNENNTKMEIKNLQDALIKYEEYGRKNVQVEKEVNDEKEKLRTKLTEATKKLQDQERDAALDLKAAIQKSYGFEIDKLTKEQDDKGVDNTSRIEQAIKNRLDQRLKAIDLETQKELQAAGDIEDKKNAIFMEAQNKRLEAVKQEQNTLEQLINKAKNLNQPNRDDYGGFQVMSGFGSGGPESIPSFSGYSSRTKKIATDTLFSRPDYSLLTTSPFDKLKSSFDALEKQTKRLSDEMNAAVERINKQISPKGIPVPAGYNDINTGAYFANAYNNTTNAPVTISNTYNIGGQGITPDAHVQSTAWNLAKGIRNQMKNAHLGTIDNDISYPINPYT